MTKKMWGVMLLIYTRVYIKRKVDLVVWILDKKPKNVTRSDVAKRAEVSETIVSYVMNGKRYVDKDKRARVLAAIKELNYKPNNIARTLKGKRSNNIVLIADKITNEHFSQIVYELDQLAYKEDRIISLCTNRNDWDFVSRIISRCYDGIIISSLSMKEAYIQAFLDAGIPVVLLMTKAYHLEGFLGKIYTGLYEGALACTNHLIERGKKNIIYLDRFSTSGNFSKDDDWRLKGFKDCLKAHHLPYGDEQIITGCKTEEEVAGRIQRLIERDQPVDAFFGRSDALASIASSVISKSGRRIPEDIGVIGFDNSRIGRYLSPTLSTVDLDRAKISAVALEMFDEMINHQRAPQSVHIEPQLIIREST